MTLTRKNRVSLEDTPYYRYVRRCLPGIPSMSSALRGIRPFMDITQRGNIRQACFAANQDCAAYAYWLVEYHF
jgi:hypothetical protein